MRGRGISRLTKKAGIPLIGTRSVNSEDYLRRVAELAPDVIVSVAAPEIFRPPLAVDAAVGLSERSLGTTARTTIVTFLFVNGGLRRVDDSRRQSVLDLLDMPRCGWLYRLP